MMEVVEQNVPTAVFPRPEGGYFIGVTLPEGNSMEDVIMDDVAPNFYEKK